MRNFSLALAVPLLIVLAAGCAGSGERATVTPAARSTMGSGTEMVTVYHDTRAAIAPVAAAAGRVWSVLPAVYEELGIPVTTMVDRDRLLGNKQAAVVRRLAGERPSAFLDCGVDGLGLPLADRYRITMSLLTSVSPTSDTASKIQTQVDAKAVQQGTSGDAVICNTTGRLEKLILQMVQTRLRAAGS